MKQQLLRLFLTAFVALVSASGYAYDALIDGIYYDFNLLTLTATVTSETGSFDSSSYSGTVEIPSSVTYVGRKYTVTSIGDYAFFRCTGLTSITIPNSVTSIGYDAFYGCKGLTSVTIPNSVTSIAVEAFSWTGLTSVIIPNSVTSIEAAAFSGCEALPSIDVENGNPNYCSIDGVLFSKDKTTLIQYPGGKRGSYSIPNSVTCIGNNAFTYCRNLTSVTIPNSVTSIGFAAFWGCTDLTSADLPNSVNAIGSKAFYGCTGLTSVTIPYSVTSIGEGAFLGCDNVRELVYAEGCKTVLQTDLRSIEKVTIPNTVTRIGDYAFCGCLYLTSVIIPNSVTSIGDYAFYECIALTSVTIGSSVEKLSGAFGGCYCVKELIYAEGCKTALRTGLESIEKVTIPNSVTSIADKAFQSCTKLTSVAIPNSVTSIGDWAFSGCSGLNSVTIGNSVTSIGKWAFRNCDHLTSVTIPNSVNNIGKEAFSRCFNLKDIYCLSATPPVIESDTFMVYGTLHVIPGTKAIYEADEYWKKFSRIIEDAENPEVVGILLPANSNETDALIFDINGRPIHSTAAHGIFISGGRKRIK